MPDLPVISVIIPIRNRTRIRLENCLRSLRWQDVAPKTIEIILSDFGSDPEPAAEIRALAERFGAHVVRTDTTELWNRSRALNHAIAAAKSEYVFCTDADMIFEANFVSTILDVLREKGRPALVCCRCRDLPSDVPEQPYELADVADLRRRATFRRANGTGACHAVRRDWLVRIGGYDERYVFWGFEDKDLVLRARVGGLRIAWIHDRSSMMHQWHPTVKNDRILLKYRNQLRYLATGLVVTKPDSVVGRLSSDASA